MTPQEVADQLAQLLSGVTPQLAPAELLACANLALMPDSEGRRPGMDGYVPTSDPDWAMAEALTLIHLRIGAASTETITKITSEGSTFDISTGTPDWLSLARSYRMRSWIGRQIGYGDQLGTVDLPTGGIDYQPASKEMWR